MIALDRVSKFYRAGPLEVPALNDVSLEIETGDFVAVLGPSGSGKSTLLNMIGLLDRPTDGTYHLDGNDVAALNDDQKADLRNTAFGFVFQSYNLVARMNALQNVEMPLIYAGERQTRRDKALSALAAVGLDERALHLPSALSGGEQQRVAIARALVTDPRILLADEPTGNVDTQTSAQIMRMISHYSDGRTVIVVTHEAAVAAYASRVVRIQDGRIVYDERQEPGTVMPRRCKSRGTRSTGRRPAPPALRTRATGHARRHTR